MVLQPVVEMENSEFRPVKLCLKIDLVLHPVRAEGLGKYTLCAYTICQNGQILISYIIPNESPFLPSRAQTFNHFESVS